jgi:hypothetical protein
MIANASAAYSAGDVTPVSGNEAIAATSSKPAPLPPAVFVLPAVWPPPWPPPPPVVGVVAAVVPHPLLLTATFVEVLLVLVLDPEVALPPLVLPEVVAVPDVDV